MPSYLVGESDAEGVLVKAKVCNRGTGEALPTMAGDFTGIDRDGGMYTVASSSWDEWPPQPQYPWETTVQPGRCLTGWILLSADPRTRLERVALIPYGGDGVSIVEWTA